MEKMMVRMLTKGERELVVTALKQYAETTRRQNLESRVLSSLVDGENTGSAEKEKLDDAIKILDQSANAASNLAAVVDRYAVWFSGPLFMPEFA